MPLNRQPEFPRPGEIQIHVLEQAPETDLAKDFAVLSTMEKYRAGRLLLEAKRRQFVAAHAMKRRLLASYLQADPMQLIFSYGPHGKPSLAGDHGRMGLEFNLSHSANRIMLALAMAPVGVDVERVRGLDFMKLARRFFSGSEIKQLESLPESLLAEGFFNAWTRKEALMKAKGDGLSLALGSFDVALDPRRPAALLATRYAPQEVGQWTIREVDAGNGYKAAVAVAGEVGRIRIMPD